MIKMIVGISLSSPSVKDSNLRDPIVRNVLRQKPKISLLVIVEGFRGK
jgi:hypothetical protein